MAPYMKQCFSPVYHTVESTTQNHNQHQLEKESRDLFWNDLNPNYDYNNNYNRQLQYAQQQKQRQVSRMSQLIHMDFPLISYYQYIHNAHPIMLPLAALRGGLARHFPTETIDVMRYIGSHYIPSDATGKEKKLTMNEISLNDMNPDGFKVQCMLLHAIVFHAEDRYDEARESIEEAVVLATSLGMHRDEFAIRNNYGSPLMEEMWRRTYWELYVVENLLYGLQEENGSLYKRESDMHLPCDEAMSDQQQSMPETACSFQELSDYWDQRPDQVEGLPSFAYRISAVNLLGSVLALDKNNAAAVDELDNDLTRLVNHCSYQTANEDHAKEIIFQAQAVVLSAMIYLWRPLSKINPLQFASSSSMPIFPPSFLQSSRRSPSMSLFKGNIDSDPSSTKLVNAAKYLGRLLAMPDAVNLHSPFLINAAALGILVHMAALTVLQSTDAPLKETLQNHLTNTVGVLRRFAMPWPLAKSVNAELTRAYRDRFSSRP